MIAWSTDNKQYYRREPGSLRVAVSSVRSGGFRAEKRRQTPRKEPGVRAGGGGAGRGRRSVPERNRSWCPEVTADAAERGGRRQQDVSEVGTRQARWTGPSFTQHGRLTCLSRTHACVHTCTHTRTRREAEPCTPFGSPTVSGARRLPSPPHPLPQPPRPRLRTGKGKFQTSQFHL